MKKCLYCENCLEEIKLNKYIVDCLGGVFCNEDCLENSLEYRELKKLPKFEYIEMKGGLKE